MSIVHEIQASAEKFKEQQEAANRQQAFEKSLASDASRHRIAPLDAQRRQQLLAWFDESAKSDQDLLLNIAKIHYDRNQKGK